MEGEEDPDLLLAIALSESLLSQSRDSDGSNVEEASREESNSTFSSSDSIQVLYHSFSLGIILSYCSGFLPAGEYGLVDRLFGARELC